MAKGLQKQYIKAAGGDFKKAWKLQKAAKGKKKGGGKAKRKNNPGGRKMARRRSFSIGRMVGAIGTGYQMIKQYRHQRDRGRSSGGSVMYVLTGYDTDPTGINDFAHVGARLADSYSFAIGGEVAHQVLGNSKGAWGTGIGFKFNASLPKGFNI